MTNRRSRRNRQKKSQKSPDLSIKRKSPDLSIKRKSPDLSIKQKSPDLSIKQKSPDISIKQKSPDLSIKQKSPDLEDIEQVSESQKTFTRLMSEPNLIIQAFRKHEKEREIETKISRDGNIAMENGLKCTSVPVWLGIKCYGDKLLALNPEGKLFLYDSSSRSVHWSTSTGNPLHVFYGSMLSSVACRGLFLRVYKRTNESELADPNCKASDFVGNPNEYLDGDVPIEPKKSETVLHVNLRTGQPISATNSVNDEILCIKRFDFQITCKEPGSDTVLGYRRIASIHISKVSRGRGDPRFCEKNDDPVRMGQNLVKPGTIGNICRSNRVIGEGDKGTLLVEGEYKKPAVIVCIKKGQSHDDVKRVVNNFVDLCGANPNFVKLYAVEKDPDFSYIATERYDTSLRDFIESYHKENKHLKEREKLLKLIRGIITAIASLHYNGISHGNIDINNIFVDKYSKAKIQVIGKGWRIRDPTFKDGFSLSKEATDDMYALGKVIYFCFTGVEYKDEHLYNLEPEKYLKPVYDCPDSLDFLRKLLVKNAAERVTASQASNHTLFWSSRKKLRFIRAVAERLELKGNTLLCAIKSINQAVFGNRWDSGLPTDFIDLMKNESYGTIWVNSMYDLICIIRNLVSHETRIRDQSKIKSSKDTEVHKMFGPAGFESYFRRKFPNLVNQVYNAMGKHLGEEPNFLQFYNKKPL